MMNTQNNSSHTPPPILRQVRELRAGHCDSVTLDLQKFPDVGRKKKAKELTDFCRQVESSKRHVPTSWKIPQFCGARSFSAVNRGRLLVNHTGGIVENSNLALHRFFGFPIIPGSALKGIARSAASAMSCEEDKERFARVFGDLEKGGRASSDEDKERLSGSVAFLQALPANSEWKMTVDVLTSHKGCDTKNPVPVFFPAVEVGAVFEFTIAPTARTQDGDLDFAEKYLKIALSENGVGAKTAAGYGWFEIIGGQVDA